MSDIIEQRRFPVLCRERKHNGLVKKAPLHWQLDD